MRRMEMNEDRYVMLMKAKVRIREILGNPNTNIYGETTVDEVLADAHEARRVVSSKDDESQRDKDLSAIQEIIGHFTKIPLDLLKLETPDQD
jgi:hypothetical protein